jgi:hypothetical protein
MSVNFKDLGERIALSAAMLSLFKGQYRDVGKRHSDALFVKDGLETALGEVDALRTRLDTAREALENAKFPKCLQIPHDSGNLARWAEHLEKCVRIYGNTVSAALAAIREGETKQP